MKRFTMYLGFALAACLSCFSFSAMAEPVITAYHSMVASGEPQGVAFKRLELTLAMWRAGSQTSDEALKTNLLASSNHFVMASAKPEPDGIGIGAGISHC
jgi:hypothetical protein